MSFNIEILEYAFIILEYAFKPLFNAFYLFKDIPHLRRKKIKVIKLFIH